jgi:hypothetical protein
MGGERCMIVRNGLCVTLPQFRKHGAQRARCPRDVGLGYIRSKCPAPNGEAA